MSAKIDRKTFVKNLTEMLEKHLIKELPKEGYDWEMVKQSYILIRNRMVHIQAAIEQVERGV